jgi:hypothetical protein
MNAEGSGVDNLPRVGGLSYTQQNGDPAESERRSQGTPRTRRTGQQINHNESTLILLPGCPKNGVHLTSNFSVIRSTPLCPFRQVQDIPIPSDISSIGASSCNAILGDTLPGSPGQLIGWRRASKRAPVLPCKRAQF